jgi:hypothetical protein
MNPTLPSPTTSPIHLGTRRELFVDDHLIDRMKDLRFSLQHPERRETFTFDAPWEDSNAFPNAVLHTPNLTRLYYRASIANNNDEEKSTLTGVIESRDGGITFTRPTLQLHTLPGAPRNNIIGHGVPGVPPAFLDTNPACKESERYKGLHSYAGQLFAMSSPDGLAWRLMHPKPLNYSGAFDTINTAFWDATSACYRSYTRVWVNRETSEGLTRIRCIQSAISPDFLHWSTPVENTYADGQQDVHLYTNATLPCPGAEHIYLAFPNRFMERRWIKRTDSDTPPHSPGCNDALFMASRNGVDWTRYLNAWVRPGPDPRTWTQRNNYPTWGIVQTSSTQWSMYISEHYGQPDAPGRLRRLAIRPHGFVSLHADFNTGEFLTKPLTFAGPSLRLNYATSAAGHIQVEIQDTHGNPLQGFALQDMDPLFGDEIDGGVTWNGASDLSPLIGRPLRLRFVLKDADLFALRFTSDKRDVTRGMVIKPSPPTYRTRAMLQEMRVPRAHTPPPIDGTTLGFDWSHAVAIHTPDQFNDYCNAKVALMYDDHALYIAAEVADPHPMVNALSLNGDMSRSWSADALQIHLRALTDAPPASSDADINDIRLWYSTTDAAPAACIFLGMDIASAKINPPGVIGAFQLREGGKGYRFTYRLPWSALNSARPPHKGERLTACLQCHWGTPDGENLLCGGVEIRSDNAPEVYVAESWGHAIFE